MRTTAIIVLIMLLCKITVEAGLSNLVLTFNSPIVKKSGQMCAYPNEEKTPIPPPNCEAIAVPSQGPTTAQIALVFAACKAIAPASSEPGEEAPRPCHYFSYGVTSAGATMCFVEPVAKEGGECTWTTATYPHMVTYQARPAVTPAFYAATATEGEEGMVYSFASTFPAGVASTTVSAFAGEGPPITLSLNSGAPASLTRGAESALQTVATAGTTVLTVKYEEFSYVTTITPSASNNALLSSPGLPTSGVSLAPSFSSAITKYAAVTTTATSTLALSPVAADVQAKLYMGSTTYITAWTDGVCPLAVRVNDISLGTYATKEACAEACWAAVGKRCNYIVFGKGNSAGVCRKSGTTRWCSAKSVCECAGEVCECDGQEPEENTDFDLYKVFADLVTAGSTGPSKSLVVATPVNVSVMTEAGDGVTNKVYTLLVTRGAPTQAPTPAPTAAPTAPPTAAPTGPYFRMLFFLCTHYTQSDLFSDSFSFYVLDSLANVDTNVCSYRIADSDTIGCAYRIADSNTDGSAHGSSDSGPNCGSDPSLVHRSTNLSDGHRVIKLCWRRQDLC